MENINPRKVSLPRPCAFLEVAHDPDDPNPWQTLWLDRSVPIHPDVKQAWLRDSNTVSRQFLLPFVRPLARLTIVLFQIIKTLIPNRSPLPAFSTAYWHGRCQYSPRLKPTG